MRARLRSMWKSQQRCQSHSQSSPMRNITPDTITSSLEGSSSIAPTDDCSHGIDEPHHPSDEPSPTIENENSNLTSADGLWHKVKRKYQLVDFHALPEYLRENEFILKHYRADWPIREALLSFFRIHNETLNIWTHFIGFLLFLGLTIYTARQVPKDEYISTFTNLRKFQVDTMACLPSIPQFVYSLFGVQHDASIQEQITTNVTPSNPQCIVRAIKDDLGRLMEPLMRKPTTRWPFFIFLGGAMFCLLTSSTCHLLCCHSSRLSYFLWRCDYAGIATMIATSFFPPIYYTFLCHPKWRNFYLTSISVLGILTALTTLMPFLQRNKYRTLRTLLFCGMGISGVIPGIHKLISHTHEEVTFTTTTYEVLMSLFYGLGALFYATRIPERWMPGSFDIAGHSHQIFHILVICGAYTHYKAALLYVEWRDKHGCD